MQYYHINLQDDFNLTPLLHNRRYKPRLWAFNKTPLRFNYHLTSVFELVLQWPTVTLLECPMEVFQCSKLSPHIFLLLLIVIHHQSLSLFHPITISLHVCLMLLNSPFPSISVTFCSMALMAHGV